MSQPVLTGVLISGTSLAAPVIEEVVDPWEHLLSGETTSAEWIDEIVDPWRADSAGADDSWSPDAWTLYDGGEQRSRGSAVEVSANCDELLDPWASEQERPAPPTAAFELIHDP